MRTSLIAVATLGVSALTMSANASTLIAYWNFNDYDTGAMNLAADHGVGNINLNNWGGTVTSFVGSTINALFDDPSGGSLSLVAGGTGNPANGTWIDLTFSMSGLQDLIVTFATRGTGTGFDSGIWSWSTDGANFNVLMGVNTATTSTSFALATADFSGIAGLYDAPTVTLRYTLDGATGSGTGNNRIDNLQVNAAAIPAPGVLALLGVAGLVGVRRRRNG